MGKKVLNKKRVAKRELTKKKDDVSNSTKTWEERKEEMIMKAFGNMVKNNARKRNKSETSSSVPDPEK